MYLVACYVVVTRSALPGGDMAWSPGRTMRPEPQQAKKTANLTTGTALATAHDEPDLYTGTARETAVTRAQAASATPKTLVASL